MIGRAVGILQRRGLCVMVRASLTRLQGIFASQAKSFRTHRHLFFGKTGLEIGGPSAVFAKSGIFPVYGVVQCLDNWNYSNITAWNTDVKRMDEFRFDPNKQYGREYIGEATSMGVLASNVYDFILSSHMLEHTANPIGALKEWKRLLRSEGTLVLILPNKKYTFDHQRPATTLEHLVSDFELNVQENDLTHLPEILMLHDFHRDPDAPDPVSFKFRGLHNLENRCLHHHVFDAQLARDIVEYVGLKFDSVEECSPHHIVLLAQKKINSD
jgi:SAM-dependent methyltransferase